MLHLRLARWALAWLLALACAEGPTRTPTAGAAATAGRGGATTVLSFSGSEVGAEGEVLHRQLERFERLHPGLRVELRQTPDAADQRHQLYVQWLNARAATPDVLQLDVIWTPEFAAAGWLRPLEPFAPAVAQFFPQAVEANRWNGTLFALPWFVDVGMLYWRTDLLDAPPASLAALQQLAASRGGTASTAAATPAPLRDSRSPAPPPPLPYGFVWQGARYEGLVTVYLEVLGGFGGSILDDAGAVAVDRPEAIRALDYLRALFADGASPPAVLTWQEEQSRFAFQNRQALFMRNWPYAFALMQDPAQSRVAGRFSVAPMPAAPGGSPTAALGGSQLAINAFSAHPREAWALVEFLTAPEQMLERARIAGQFPARPELYRGPLEGFLPFSPAEALRIIEHARPRPVSPVYTELSEILQVHLHRALTGQSSSREALSQAAAGMRDLLERTGLARAAETAGPGRPRGSAGSILLAVLVLLGLLTFVIAARGRRRRLTTTATAAGSEGAAPESRLGWLLVAPALGTIALVALFPLAWTVWESLHANDLRLPWRGRPFVGLENYAEMLSSGRFWQALGHTVFFTAASVGLEMALGLVFALALNRAFRGRGLVRAAVLVPWAIPTVVAAIIWRFLFDAQTGVVQAALARAGVVEPGFVWFVHAAAAWVPVILADVWKTTPFVALLLLAGLQGIDDALYEAASVDGASRWQQLRFVTLPLLRPALLVALLFRTLDAFRVFDLIYVLTGGGPGSATEPIALLTFNALLQNLRFGYGSALGVVVFAVTLALALVYLRVLGAGLTRGEP